MLAVAMHSAAFASYAALIAVASKTQVRFGMTRVESTSRISTPEKGLRPNMNSEEWQAWGWNKYHDSTSIVVVDLYTSAGVGSLGL